MVPDVSWIRLPAINLGTWQPVVRGESSYIGALERLACGRNGLGTRRRLFTATLVREPDNPHDPNAVRVCADGETIGYIALQKAARYGRLVARIEADGASATCRARLTGGWNRDGNDQGNIGVELCVGASPAKWNGKVPFLSRLPFHDDVPVVLLIGLPAEQVPAHKALTTLVPVDDALAVRYGDTWIGHVIGRPDLVRFVNSLIAVGTPATAELRHKLREVVIPIADCEGLAEQFFALAGGSLKDIRKVNRITGRWACTRCGLVWTDPRQPPQHWYDTDHGGHESPHVCPECGSYAYTHQY